MSPVSRPSPNHIFRLVAAAIERVGGEHEEEDKDNGGQKTHYKIPSSVSTELTINITDLVPAHMGVALIPYVGNPSCCPKG